LDPFEKFQRWYGEAESGGERVGLADHLASSIYRLLRGVVSRVFASANLFRPDVATLATVASGNKPSARSVLYRGVVDGGFTFYTDFESDKGRELASNSSAVMVFYWSLPPRQVRIEGHVERLSRGHAEAYWRTRTRANQAPSASVRQSSIARVGGDHRPASDRRDPRAHRHPGRS
jgi:pyridoxamine 5'-phosphate oxidase